MGNVPKLIDTLCGLFDNFLSNPTRFEYGKSGQTRHFGFDCLTWITALSSAYLSLFLCLLVALTVYRHALLLHHKLSQIHGEAVGVVQQPGSITWHTINVGNMQISLLMIDLNPLKMVPKVSCSGLCIYRRWYGDLANVWFCVKTRFRDKSIYRFPTSLIQWIQLRQSWLYMSEAYWTSEDHKIFIKHLFIIHY